jgi:hypothetical protein
MNVVVESAGPLLRIPEILDSNLNPKTGYPEIYRVVLQYLQPNAETVLPTRP